MKEKYLPEVLREEEVAATLKSITIIKHIVLIMSLYSSGLRICEAVNLKLKISIAIACRYLYFN